MRIAVCDDSVSDLALVSELLEDCLSERAITCDIHRYADGTELLCDVEEEMHFDIVFLDIYMEHMLGINVARKLRNMGYRGEIVFLTASSEYAVDSYEVEACGYLLKPHSYQKLCDVMERVLKKFSGNTYPVTRRAQVYHLPYEDILFIESNNSKCVIHCTNGEEYVVYKQLGEIEEELDNKRFLRSHRSYLVNMDYIRQADKQFVLTSGDIVLIRQKSLKEIRDAYLAYRAGKKA